MKRRNAARLTLVCLLLEAALTAGIESAVWTQEAMEECSSDNCANLDLAIAGEAVFEIILLRGWHSALEKESGSKPALI